MSLYTDKNIFLKNIIDNIQTAIFNYRSINVMNQNEYNYCMEGLDKIINIMNTLSDDNLQVEFLYITNAISSLIKNYGIYNLEYLLDIYFENFTIDKLKLNELSLEKYKLLKKYAHPINYKIINWDEKTSKIQKKKIDSVSKNKIVDDKMIIECLESMDCLDLMRTSTNFNIRVYGIKIIIHDTKNKKTLCINCIIDDILLDNINNIYIINKKSKILDICNLNNNIKSNIVSFESWKSFMDNLTLKEYLIYNETEIFNKYVHINNQISLYEQKTINSMVQDFIGSDLFQQRSILIQLLLNNDKNEMQYIAYLLYDLLSPENPNQNDSSEQKLLYNSLTWKCKSYFKDAMSKTIEYTSNLSNFDNNKIPLEQQICLMKASDTVKEKAMQKLKELKSKSEDSGSKARQYLDGLLKIPFGIYKEEYIMSKKHEISSVFNNLTETFKTVDIKNINNKIIENYIISSKELIKLDNYNTLEILNIINKIDKNLLPSFNLLIENIINIILTSKKKTLIYIINSINVLCNKYNISQIKYISNDKTITIKNILKEFLNNKKNDINFMKDLITVTENIIIDNTYKFIINIDKNINKIKSKNNDVLEYVTSFNDILNNAVYGHNNAKKQIERILGQWINGENSGYCFGFEGPPGIGKTSLAKKGIANCLKDINGKSRPFSLIALGGATHGSILDGHNYTYVGSTWGKIVDILMENKCMNPIIFIDELDKVSKTEHGKEIIGILTHLIDSTQNDTFQDKYFSNIDLNLSKALFIFSYNDVELIDRILLDRIHRIKFDSLLLDDKLIITKNYLLPELYKKFGIENIINIKDELLHHIIENYTMEPGVRKLKEILFEIISSINLDILKNKNTYEIPIEVTSDLIKEILQDRHKIRYLTINDDAKVGIINGLWANAYGGGGILHIECKYFYTSTFLELKLTGMQGDVMKESMSVAKTLALSLISKEEMDILVKEFESTKMQGIHIHVPEGATPKDGPSAGGAITLVLYSLLTKKKIRNDFAITGEICLQGKVTAIGGLDLKIWGGIRAGVKSFLYPKENEKDLNLFYKKHKEKLEKYNFYQVEDIKDVIKYMIVE